MLKFYIQRENGYAQSLCHIETSVLTIGRFQNYQTIKQKYVHSNNTRFSGTAKTWLISVRRKFKGLIYKKNKIKNTNKKLQKPNSLKNSWLRSQPADNIVL